MRPVTRLVAPGPDVAMQTPGRPVTRHLHRGHAEHGGGPAGGGGGTGLPAEQRYEYHRPVRAGDVLTATTRPGNRWTKTGRRGGTLNFMEFVTEYRDPAGELVVTATSVGVITERVVEQEGS